MALLLMAFCPASGGPRRRDELIEAPFTGGRRRKLSVVETYVRSMHGSAGELQIDLVWERQVTVQRLPVAWLSDEEAAAELQRVQRRRAMDAAYEAELILALAGQRPATLDPSPDRPGASRPGWTPAAASGAVSEFFTAELSAILNLGCGTAVNRLTRALTWRNKLPATLAAMAAGELDERRAGALADALAATTPDVAGRVEDTLLPGARELPVYRLTDRATALMLQFDAAAEERRRQAEHTADVKVYPSAADGRA